MHTVRHSGNLGATPGPSHVSAPHAHIQAPPPDADEQKKQVERESTLPFAQSAALAVTYMFGCITFFLLIRYSKMNEKAGGQKYDSAAAVFFTELLKLGFSVGAMQYRTGKFLPTSVIKDGSWRTGLYYAVPSGIYALYNNLTYWNLSNFDPGTYQVFMQTRVIFTGVLFCYIMKKSLGQRKWIALVTLSFGVAAKYMTWDLQIDGRIFFMLFQASLSAFAGVYNEFLLKRDISMDVNEQNFFMYAFALGFNLMIGLYNDPVYYTSFAFLGSLNGIVLLIVINGAVVGIVTSLILKFINVIVKAFASACEVLLTAVAAYFLLGEALTMRDFVASTIVMGAIYMYYTAPATVAAPAPVAPAVPVVAGAVAPTTPTGGPAVIPMATPSDANGEERKSMLRD
uniref:Sugar phosphate transporter domain-containing protein n=1 Tax=Neobodo designis TaxID=312471 RepID=A0A7S1Q8F3_NEODS|mmetsp:Transcript_3509/g.10896  ORF Transcript_3509/g.10896 Transcript_3509/m.10896 type:complete len:399 (+) Transcript_3509:176-1372(+)